MRTNLFINIAIFSVGEPLSDHLQIKWELLQGNVQKKFLFLQAGDNSVSTYLFSSLSVLVRNGHLLPSLFTFPVFIHSNSFLYNYS